MHTFVPDDRVLQSEDRHHPRGVAASDFRPLRKIPHCCLPSESGPCLSSSVADHPLRPATDRRLGGPLPRQLANQTQDPLFAPGLAVPRFHRQHPSSRSHAVLPLLSERYSPQKGRFPTRYSPVCHAPCGTSDLHVLGTPPAFILSQDQTLKFHSELLLLRTRAPWIKCSGRKKLF